MEGCVMSKSVSRIPGGTRVTQRDEDGSSRDYDYVDGELTTITEHSKDGESTPYNAHSGFFGPVHDSKK